MEKGQQEEAKGQPITPRQVAILAILVSMGYSALSRGRTMSKSTVCQNNLKQIAAALGLYYNDHHIYPTDDLASSLRDYVGGSPKLFICPADSDPQGDSYSQFYVARADRSTQDYVCGCPRHVNEQSAIALFSSSSAQTLEMRPVRWNGQEVPAGTSVTSGVLRFGDGSQVTIPDGMVVRLIQSFRMHDGRFYSLVGVDINEAGTLDVEVTPGSRFEVVTPAAIAGVQGTRFQVTVTVEGDLYWTRITVEEGAVEVSDRWKEGAGEVLTAGESKEIKKERKTVNKWLKWWWQWRRKHLADDGLYAPGDTDPQLDPHTSGG